MPDRYGRCVIPIHHIADPKRTESWASGVLLRVLDFRLLASAAHVLMDDDLVLPGKPFMLLDDAGRVFGTSPDLPLALRDPADLAYLILNPRAIATLEAQNYSFLSVAETSFGREPGPAEALIFSG